MRGVPLLRFKRHAHMGVVVVLECSHRRGADCIQAANLASAHSPPPILMAGENAEQNVSITSYAKRNFVPISPREDPATITDPRPCLRGAVIRQAGLSAMI